MYKRQLSDSENRLQMGIDFVNGMFKDSGLQISTIKTKVMVFCVADPVRAKIVIDGTDVYKRQAML